MVGLTGALIGSAVIGAGSSIIGGNKAAKSTKDANALGIAEQRRQYDQTRSDYAPWRTAGEGALSRLTTAMSGDTSGFKTSPGYDFRLSQSLKGLERMASARGMWNSGATRSALMERAGNLASDEYGNWFNQNLGLAGLGQNATNATSNAGQNASNNITNLYQNTGAARASSYANTASSINQGMNNVLSAYLFSRGGGFSPPSTGTPPYYPGAR